MIRYTTPTKTFRVLDHDLTGYDVRISLRQRIGRSTNAHVVDFDGGDIVVTRDGADTLLTVTLSQEDTGGFVPGRVEYQVNFGLSDARSASLIGTFPMGENLLGEEVTFNTGSATFDDEDEVVVEISDDSSAVVVGTDNIIDGAVTLPKLGHDVTEAINSKAPNTDATTATHGLMSAADKEKLDSIEAGANAYTLPTMSASTMGGAKVGSGLEVSGDVLSVSLSGSSTGAIPDSAASAPLRSAEAEGWAEQDGTPTPDNPQEIRVARGRNLFDKDNVEIIDAYFDQGTGKVTASTGDKMALIAVEPNTEYSIGITRKALTSASDGYQIAEFSSKPSAGSSGTYIAGASMTADVRATHTFTTKATTTWIIFKFGLNSKTDINATLATIQLELGSTPTPYVPYGHVGLEVNEISSLEQGNIDSNGDETTSNLRVRTDYLPVKQDVSYFMTANTVKGTADWYVHWYDENKQQVGLGSQWETKHVYEPPVNASYVRFAIRVSQEIAVTVEDFNASFISTTPIPLPSKGFAASLTDGTADKLTLNGAGKWEWESACDEVTLTGGEAWSTSSTDSHAWVYMSFPEGKNLAYNSMLSNIGENISRTSAKIDGAFWTVYNQLHFIPPVWTGDGSSDIQSWKDFLSSNPVTVLYPLATTTTESGYVDMPEVSPGCTVTIPELESVGVTWYEDGTAASLALDWADRLESELGAAVADLATEVTQNTGDIADLKPRMEVAEQRIEATRKALLRRDEDGYYDNQSVTAFLAARYDGKVYGYSEPKSTAVVVSKTGANAGLPNPSPGTLTTQGQSVYRELGPFQWFACKGSVDADGVPHVKVIRGVDTEDDWDACTENVWSMRPVVWYSVDESGAAVLGSLSDTWHQGLTPNPQAYLPDGTLRPYMLSARHGLAFEGNTPVSKPGLKGYGRNVSHNSLITQCATATTGYSGKSVYDSWYEQFMFRMIYGTKNSQSVFAGCSSYSGQYKPTVAETGVKRVILSNANADQLLVGSTMMLGRQTTTNTDRNNSNAYDVFDGAVITSIETYDANNKAVYFDVETAFDTATTYLLSTAPWHTGSCGDMDWDGTPTAAGATSGKEPFLFQGAELMNGNYEVLGDVIISNDGTTGWMPYVNPDSRDEATSLTSAYVSCETPLPTDASDSWKYPLYLSDHDGLMYGTQTGGSQTTGLCGGHYTNKMETTGLREWLSLGYLWNGGDAGLSSVYAHGGVGNARWYVWSRLSGTGRGFRG